MHNTAIQLFARGYRVIGAEEHGIRKRLRCRGLLKDA